MDASKANTVKTNNEDDYMIDDNKKNYDDNHSYASSSDEDDEENPLQQTNQVDDDQLQALAHKEEKWVWRLRILTFSVLFVVALTVCIGVIWEGRQSEIDEFEREFVALGDKFVSSFDDLFAQRIDVVATLAQSITSQAGGASHWPFVTPSDFAVRCKTVSRMAQLMSLVFMPLVKPEQVTEWSQYAAQNTAWREVALADSLGWNTTEGLNMSPIRPTIINFHNPNGPRPAVEVNPEGPYYTPVWTHYPVVSRSIENIDMRGDFANNQVPIDTAVTTGQPTFARLHNYFTNDIPRDPRYYSLKNHAVVDYRDDAFTLGFLPIFDGFGSDKKVAGLFLAIIYWRTYFDNLLPSNANGILVVLENDCGQAYTYQIEESYSQFLGAQDLHDSKYDHLVATTRIDSGQVLLQEEDEDVSEKTTCEYRVRVYPSQELEDEYKTPKPWIYAAVLAGLFLFTSAVFLFYDAMVERRQRIVLRSAQQSGQLVSSLFPSAVREQLYREQQQQQKAEQQERRPASWKRSNSMGVSPDESAPPPEGHPNSSITTAMTTTSKQAIATLYPDTTIMFADLVGFTSWSSKRSPTEVFDLLETLYEAFDNIAVRRRVFKVETIGDCYVAATGLPHAQVDHAVQLARFAHDCLQKMTLLTTTQLADRLGADTQDLKMRVGLHSGSTTAGVLRGQKSRFQLFGDTVNVASRMESTGVPGRIQCSQATADALTSRGKGIWLTSREDKVVAKGKGEMTTYWVSVKPSGAGSTRSRKSSTDSEATDNLEERLFARLSTGASNIR